MGCADVGLDIDWQYIAARVVTPIWQTAVTAMRQVAEVPGGHCDEIRGADRTTRAYWSPIPFARNRREDIESCINVLDTTVQGCVDAWASCHDAVAHLLSGGLDSSIVAACLAKSPSKPQLTCITHYGRDAGTDERPFARVAVESVGCRHVEVPLQELVSLESWDTVPVTPRPVPYLSIAQERQVIELAQQLGATAVTSGNGGDAAFYQYPNVRIAADYVRDHGFGASLLEVIVSTAALTGTSVVAVARAALSGLSWRKRSEDYAVAESLKYRKLPSAAAMAVATDQLDRFAPVFAREAAELPVAKRLHVQMLSQPMLIRSILRTTTTLILSIPSPQSQ